MEVPWLHHLQSFRDTQFSEQLGSCSAWRFCWHCVSFCSLYTAAAFRNAAVALISADLNLWMNPTEIKCATCAQVLAWARVPICKKKIPWINKFMERKVRSKSLPLKCRQFYPVIVTEWQHFSFSSSTLTSSLGSTNLIFLFIRAVQDQKQTIE